jgi:hypothetical protein
MGEMMSSEMMWGMGMGHLLVLMVLLLAAGALLRYLFSRNG